MKRLVVIMILLLSPFTGYAEELPVVCQEFPPYNYLDDSGNVIGSSTEIVTEVLQRMGFQANIKLLPLNRAYREAADGKVAILMTFAKNAEREKDLFFTEALASIEVVFFKRKADHIRWNELSDVKDFRVGYVQGYDYGGTMMDAIRNKTFNKPDVIAASATVDFQQMLKLLYDRIDLAVCPKTQCSRIIRMNSPKFDDLDYIDKSIGPAREFYAGFSRKWPNAETLRDQFNNNLKKLRSEGRLNTILKKHELAN
ncbi:MAG TPA: hypothetical protein DCE18_01920 [Syntrophobacteraceae bacterium]|nr:hypothetical protein [Syntrophobacteraceae bacterium]